MVLQGENRETYLKNCWRLILGQASERQLGQPNNQQIQEMESMLDYLYQREYGGDGDENGEFYMGEGGGSGNGSGKNAGRGSKLTTWKWLKEIRRIFPQKTVEIMEQHAINKYQLKEMLTDKKVLESIEPSKALLQTILEMKSHMNPDVLSSAKRIVNKIIQDIKLPLEEKMKARFSSLLNRNRSTIYSMSGELDFIKTIGKNLKNIDIETKQVLFEDFYFYENIHKKSKWEIIIAVDESGSMMESVLYSSIMAAIFAAIPIFRTKLVIFDTEVIDLSSEIDNIIEIMFQIRLGGGTDIAKALGYCSTLIKNPHKTIVVLISDFYDWNMNNFYAEAARILEGGSKLFGIGALTDDGKGDYDKQAAKKLSEMGANVAALTPEALADWVKDVVG